MEGQWDVIMFHHVFEHLEDPFGMLRACWRLLSDAGCCLLRIPTVSSYAWKHYGGNWVHLDAPRHFFLHSRQSIGASRPRSGSYSITSNTTRPSSSSGGANSMLATSPEVAQLICRGPHPVDLHPREIRQFAVHAQELNRQEQGDQAAFLLRKS